MKPYPALCRDCKHSMPEPGFDWNLRCMHPVVNAGDHWALSSSKPHGSEARSERERISLFSPCGMRGKLWEPKAAPTTGEGQ